MIRIGDIALDLDPGLLAEPGIHWEGPETSATAVPEQAIKASRELRAASLLQARLADGTESGRRWCAAAIGSISSADSGLLVAASRAPEGGRPAATVLQDIRSLPDEDRDEALAKFAWSLATGTLRALIDIHELGSHHGELEGEPALQDRIIAVPEGDGGFRILLQHPNGPLAARAATGQSATLMTREFGDASRLAELLAAIVEGRDLLEASHRVSPERLADLFGPGADRWTQFLTNAPRNPIDPDAGFLRSMLALLEPAVATAVKRVPPPTLSEQVEVQSKVVARSWAVRGTMTAGVVLVLVVFGFPMVKRLLRPEHALVVERWSATDGTTPREDRPITVQARRQDGHEGTPFPPTIHAQIHAQNYAFAGEKGEMVPLNRLWKREDGDNLATYTSDAVLPQKAENYRLQFFADEEAQIRIGHEVLEVTAIDDPPEARNPTFVIDPYGNIVCSLDVYDIDSEPTPPAGMAMHLPDGSDAGVTLSRPTESRQTDQNKTSYSRYEWVSRLEDRADLPAWGKTLTWISRGSTGETRAETTAPPFPVSIQVVRDGRPDSGEWLEEGDYAITLRNPSGDQSGNPLELTVSGPEGMELVQLRATVGSQSSDLKPGDRWPLGKPEWGPADLQDVSFEVTIKSGTTEYVFKPKGMQLRPTDDPWQFVEQPTVETETQADGGTAFTVTCVLKDPEGLEPPDSIFVRVSLGDRPPMGEIELMRQSCTPVTDGHECTFNGTRRLATGGTFSPKVALYLREDGGERFQDESTLEKEITVLAAEIPDPKPTPPDPWTFPVAELRENESKILRVEPSGWKDTTGWNWSVRYQAETDKAPLQGDGFRERSEENSPSFNLTPPEWFEPYEAVVTLTAFNDRQRKEFQETLRVESSNQDPTLTVTDESDQELPLNGPPIQVDRGQPLLLIVSIADPDRFKDVPESLLELRTTVEGPFRRTPSDDRSADRFEISATGPGNGNVTFTYGPASRTITLTSPEPQRKEPTLAGFTLEPKGNAWLMPAVRDRPNADGFAQAEGWCEREQVQNVIRSVQSKLDGYKVRLPTLQEAKKWELLPTSPEAEDVLARAVDSGLLSEAARSPRSGSATSVKQIAERTGFTGQTKFIEDILDRSEKLKPDALFIAELDGAGIYGLPYNPGKVRSLEQLETFMKMVRSPDWPGGPWPNDSEWPTRAKLRLVIEPEA